MRSFLLVLALLFAGCADVDPAPETETVQDLQPLVDPAYVDFMDLEADPPQDEVRLIAYRATVPTQVEYTAKEDVHHSGAGNHASRHLLWYDAPVDAMLARVAGDLDAPIGTPHNGGGSGGGCGGAVDTTIRIAGQTYYEATPGCSGRSQGGSDMPPFALAAGQWLLVGIGLCGLEPDHIEAQSEWTMEVRANETLERVELPAAPFACGLGFDDHYETNILGNKMGDATLMFDTLYGATIWFHAETGADGEWHLNGTDIPIVAAEFERYKTSAAGPVGFTVRSDDGGWPKSWTIVGI